MSAFIPEFAFCRLGPDATVKWLDVRHISSEQCVILR